MWIFYLCFALLSVVGGFIAWRKSPLYSLKITLELLGAMLLIVAAVVLVTQGIMAGRLSRSPIAQGVLTFAAILIITTLAMILIVRITDRHVAKLPPSTRLVTFNRHKISRWIWRMVAYLVMSAVLSLLLPHSWYFWPLGVAGFVLLICGPTLALLYMMARRNDLGMTSVMANPWAHWQYTPEQWSAWAENQRQWEQSRSIPWKWKSVALFVLLCSTLFALGAIFTDDTLQEKIIMVGALTGVLTITMLVTFFATRGSIDRRYRTLLAASPEAWLGDEGSFSNGSYTPWILSGKYLTEATLEPTAIPIQFPGAVIVLIFESFSSNSSRLVAQRILIPETHLGDIAALQQKLKARCPTAAVRLLHA